MEITEARKLLGLNADFTADDLQQAWRSSARAAHPDAGGTDQLMAQVNAARDLLEGRATSARATTVATCLQLVINTAGELFGPDGTVLGRCGSVAAAERFCQQTGWDYTVSRELQAV